MKLFIVLPYNTTARAKPTQNIFDFFSNLGQTIWYKHFIYVKTEWDNERVQKIVSNSYPSFAVFTSKQDAVAWGEETKRRNDGEDYPKEHYQFDDHVLVGELEAPLILTVEATYDKNTSSFTIDQVAETELYSDYNHLNFELSATDLNENLRNFSLQKMLGDKLFKCVLKHDLNSLENLLQEESIRDSLNQLHYQAVMPESFKENHPHIYNHFRDTSHYIHYSMSDIEEVDNTNQLVPILFEAVMTGNAEIVKLLIANGANTDVVYNGMTPQSLAESLQNDNVLSAFEEVHHNKTARLR